MIGLFKCCDGSANVTRKDVMIAAGLTVGSALVVAAIMVVGSDPRSEAIGLTMFPGVIGVGTQWLAMRDRARSTQVAVIGGTFAVLFLIGLVAGVILGD